MKTNFLKIDVDWVAIKNACRVTVNKDHTEIYPSATFKKQIIISEHSPIRLGRVLWIWQGIKSFIATHYSRHRWECFISTQRTDRTGIDRSELSQEEPVNFEGEANIQHLIDTWRKRLCFCASPETRKLAEDFKMTLKENEPEVSNALVPNCVYRCGCPEFEACGYYDQFKKASNLTGNETIQERYDLYNQLFYVQRGEIYGHD